MTKFLRPLALVAATLAATSAMAGVTFYEAENFGGRLVTMDGTVSDFRERGFNDRAMSAVVEGAPVEVCLDINFNGGCTVLNPGRYPTLGNVGGQISSVRTARGDMRGDYRDGYRGDNRGDMRGDNRGDMRGDMRDGRGGGRWGSATLYSGPNMTGRAVTLDRQGAEDLMNFNDRASSLKVERGYWIFCSEPQFRGECRTFGPGEYRQLPPDLDNRISSGRRISNQYPYAQSPNWENRR